MAERNRRLAARFGGTDAARDPRRSESLPSPLPLLCVPPEAALTPALFLRLQQLPRQRSYRIVWSAAHPPLWWRAADHDGTPDDLDMKAGEVLDVSTADARRAAAWRLLEASGKPNDGWLSKHVHRKISRQFSYVLLRLGWSAHVATLFALAIGLLAAYMMAQTSHATMIAGGMLFWFASIADGIDGEMARLTFSESRFGEQLDTGVDQLTHLCGLTGVLVGWMRQGIGPSGVTLALIVLAGTPMTLLWAMALVRRARRTDQFFVPTKPIETAISRAAADTGAATLRASAVVFLLFRREAFSLAFFVIALFTSRRAAIPVAIAVGLAVVLFTFVIHRSTLERALRETAGPRPADTTRVPAARRSTVQA